ncbi:MAG TPA: HD domain-containing phosphohydrolase [Pirellulaceae bacterium]|nr:HD domain-containing phosphohydrolase [Pirellulaceae bacterium]
MLDDSPEILGYLPVATATLCPATVMGCELFIQRGTSSLVELFKGANYPLDVTDVERLRTAGIDHLYVRLEAADAYRDYLRENVLQDDALPAGARVKALREVTRVVFEQALSRGNAGELVQTAVEFGRGMATMMSEKSLLFREIFRLIEHDFYTFTHVCNVSTYCVMLAQALGETNADRLTELAAAGLLHDVGKRHIPAAVLNKPGRLTPAEWELVVRHPADGYLELKQQKLSWGQLMVVYQHHERMDGSGYPTGVRGDEIHPWAKICGLVDVFDAMTCKRPYRKAIAIDDVCSHLNRQAGVTFETEIVNCWLAQVRRKS